MFVAESPFWRSSCCLMSQNSARYPRRQPVTWCGYGPKLGNWPQKKTKRAGQLVKITYLSVLLELHFSATTMPMRLFGNLASSVVCGSKQNSILQISTFLYRPNLPISPLPQVGPRGSPHPRSSCHVGRALQRSSIGRVRQSPRTLVYHSWWDLCIGM